MNPSPEPSTSTGWRIAAHASPAVRRYGEEFVVHHALSNDTLRVSAAAGGLLLELMTAGERVMPSGNVCSTLRDPTIENVLQVLAELGFIERC